MGGNLNVLTHEIVSSSNRDIVVAPNGTGSLVVKDEKSLKLNESTNTYSVAMKAPNTLAASYSLTWPLNNGDASQLLSSDGSGVLSWVDALLVSQNLADLNNVATARDNLGVDARPTYEAIDNTDSPVTGVINYHYSVDTSTAAVEIDLPAISGLSTGQRIYIKLKTAGNDLTLDPNGSDTIDGLTSYVLDVQHSALTLVVGARS